MIVKKIKKLIEENREYHKEQLFLLKELDWANVYHDSIRGKSWLENLPLNIGRWAGNYSFFYVLNRVLNDYKPKTILELGLGESTKFVTTYLNCFLTQSEHLVIEHDGLWKEAFLNNNMLCERTHIALVTLGEKEIKGFKANYYEGLASIVKPKYDLYIIDGPFGSPNFSRYNIIELVSGFSPNDEFVIIFDDCNRQGEQETLSDVFDLFSKKKIIVSSKVFDGSKSLMVIATTKYKLLTSV